MNDSFMPQATKVLYLAGGNLAQPKAGMDVVSRIHLQELLAEKDFDVSGVFVVPTQPKKAVSPPVSSWPGIAAYAGDLGALTTSYGTLLFKLSYLLVGGVLGNVGYVSAKARAHIRQALRAKTDVVVIDHFAVLANLGLSQLAWMVWVQKSRVVYISHDVMPEGFWDSLRLKPHLLSKLWGLVQVVQTFLMEVALCRLCSRVVFISERDRRWYGRWAGVKTHSLCPVLPERPQFLPDESRKVTQGPFVVFIGSPGFPPNAFAMRWLVEHLAPALLDQAPDLKIVLIGQGTETLVPANHKSVIGVGFLADADLLTVLGQSLGLVSPVIHGSGLKIKVLEALAAGIPVFATAESLRGYEFMGIEPAVWIDNPKATATELAALAQSPTRQVALRKKTQEAWQVYKAWRKGKLAEMIRERQ